MTTCILYGILWQWFLGYFCVIPVQKFLCNFLKSFCTSFLFVFSNVSTDTYDFNCFMVRRISMCHLFVVAALRANALCSINSNWLNNKSVLSCQKRRTAPLKIAYITSTALFLTCQPLWVVYDPSATPWAPIRAPNLPKLPSKLPGFAQASYSQVKKRTAPF